MAPHYKLLAAKYEALSLDPRTHGKCGVWASIYNQALERRGGGYKTRSLGLVGYQHNQQTATLRFHESPCYKGMRQKMID